MSARQFRMLIVAAMASALCHAAAENFVLAGGSELFVVDDAAKGVPAKLWRWSAEDVAEFSDAEKRAFNHLDECKPAADGSRLFVCASNGGCAIIGRPSGRVLWHARVTNAHSLEPLPRDRVVVASSLSGDRLVLFDTKGAEPLWETPLHSAHGVVWDDGRRCLWALGFDELRRYTLKDWDTESPSLELQAAHKLPGEDGHDLRAVPKSADLVVTTEKAVFLFDREKAAFRPHPLLGENARLKSVDIHPVTGRIVVSEWSNVVRLLTPDARIDLKPSRPYKARWLPQP